MPAQHRLLATTRRSSTVASVNTWLLTQTLDQLVFVRKFTRFMLGVNQVTIDHYIEDATGALDKKRIRVKGVF